MARQARRDVFDPDKISIFHCINRCVRRCFLCGVDPLTGKNYDHRKQWLEDRFCFLAGVFGIDVLVFAVLDNHFHIVLRNRPDVVALWDDEEVARRWLLVCPKRKTDDGAPETPSDEEIANIVNDRERLATLRTRLSHISWFMRMTAQPIAQDANAEDDVTGRFWQGRFISVKLCDTAALLSCCVYIDLNLIRAGLAPTPESSDHTSGQRRTEGILAGPHVDGPDHWLAPLPLEEATALPGPAPSGHAYRCSDRGFLPMSVEQYLELLDWTGRQLSVGKRGAIREDLSPILQRIGVAEGNWLELACNFGRLFHRVAGGPASVARERTPRGSRFRTGHAHLLTASA